MSVTIRRIGAAVLAVVFNVALVALASSGGAPASADPSTCDVPTIPGATDCTSTTTTTAPPATTSTTTTTTVPDTTSSTDTTTTVADSSGAADSTTTTPSDGSGPSPSATTTTTTTGGGSAASGSSSGSSSSGSSSGGASGGGSGRGDSVAAQLATIVPIPPGIDPITINGPLVPLPTDVVSSTGVRSTQPVIDALATHQLAPSLLARVLAPFPISGQASYSDAYPSPQAVPLPPGHDGIYVQAAAETPVIASDEGTVHLIADPALGNLIVLTSTDGTEYRYLHLERFASGLVDGQRVLEADLIGAVGPGADTGGPHLHYEIHPHGGAQALQTAKAVGAKASVAAASAGPKGSPSGSTSRLALRPAGSGASLTRSVGDVVAGLFVVGGMSWWFLTRRRRARAEEQGGP